MELKATMALEKKKSVYALEATNFSLADVQAGLGPFLAAYLAGAVWEPGRIGTALTVGVSFLIGSLGKVSLSTLLATI